jgi:hypothetical protein
MVQEELVLAVADCIGKLCGPWQLTHSTSGSFLMPPSAEKLQAAAAAFSLPLFRVLLSVMALEPELEGEVGSSVDCRGGVRHSP